MTTPLPVPLIERLYLLFSPAACRADPFATLADALAGGVDLVQWRVKERDEEGARQALAICRAHGARMIVNDDVELALTIGADGAHVGQDDMPARRARRLLGPHRLLGVSTHDLAQIDRAALDGADHLGFGPMFATATKGYAQGLPAGSLEDALRHTSLTIWPIGGIDHCNLGRLQAEGARRIAVSRAILGADDPRAAAHSLRAALLAADSA
ncbi:MAG: thiamine phosphate synthase [Planctomycetota bacterium]